MQEVRLPLCQAFTCLGLMLTYIYGLMVAGYSALVVRFGTYVEPCLASCMYGKTGNPTVVHSLPFENMVLSEGHSEPLAFEQKLRTVHQPNRTYVWMVVLTPLRL
ncbi:hypothetical protein VNO77_02041 [Canavalia gladiata]|uniref:Uncharacterized protein n=1 Tax=Canavalia gladiata TaxID=3824 RepID=A0AAN9MYN8_CANGL